MSADGYYDCPDCPDSDLEGNVRAYHEFYIDEKGVLTVNFHGKCMKCPKEWKLSTMVLPCD